MIAQDGKRVRAKNSKSLYIQVFPGTAAFEAVLREWIAELVGLGFRPEDALFPSERALRTARISTDGSVPRATPMKTQGAVRDAFKVACRVVGKSYTPHAARHTIANHGRLLATSPRHTRAWSENMGHANDVITDRHYGKMTQEQRFEVLAELGSEAHFSAAEHDQMLDYHQHFLARDTPAFHEAEALVARRTRARQAQRGRPRA